MTSQINKVNLELLYDKLKEEFQSYHLLANIAFRGRHESPTWETCDEQTCRNKQDLFKQMK